MSDDPKKEPVNPFALVALYAGGASAGIAFLAFVNLHRISDAGMFAIALMVAAPSLMGIGIALVMSKQPPKS